MLKKICCVCVNADLDFLFHMFFLARYCKLLEENSFRGRTADFFYMLLFGASVLTGIVLIGGMIPLVSASFAKIIFLSNSLTFMMVRCFSYLFVYINCSLSAVRRSFFLPALIHRYMSGVNRTRLFTWASWVCSLSLQHTYLGWVLLFILFLSIHFCRCLHFGKLMSS